MGHRAVPKYPVVLVPGFLGFVSLLGFDYWYGIVTALRNQGVDVYPARLSPVHATEFRGDQLLSQIAEARRRSGADKVHLFGHSQGALVCRYAAAKRPEWVASVTSLAGPHQGSELADHIERKFAHGSLRGKLLQAGVHVLGCVVRLLDSGGRSARMPINASAAHRSLTTEGVGIFNHQYPQGLPTVWGEGGPEEVNGVRYYSWSGTLQPGITDQGGNRRDPSNWFCRRFARTFVREAGQCDGMVGRVSSHLGKVIRDDYPLDHLDIVNQHFGRTGEGVNPVSLYIEHLRRLHDAGL
ncbi:esterase/lipase family protein [Phytopseudomonas seleniipraecipitans]|uniref:Triacylglycerol lipase n=1 Tax=Phytopseudomonas seleniipraecipitans TaxID=640205 RepID=A0A1G7KE39_9GAMM|nr:triacylglycerol lipase [Pseudomonas seleniipraecipitans]SDF35290.1 triacylglycerol lipase [Pseudomonas seleniipraecipitans]